MPSLSQYTVLFVHLHSEPGTPPSGAELGVRWLAMYLGSHETAPSPPFPPPLQQNPDVNPFQRTFVKQVRLGEEMERKLRM